MNNETWANDLRRLMLRKGHLSTGERISLYEQELVYLASRRATVSRRLSNLRERSNETT